jgi:hypothetical protein
MSFIPVTLTTDYVLTLSEPNKAKKTADDSTWNRPRFLMYIVHLSIHITERCGPPPRVSFLLDLTARYVGLKSTGTNNDKMNDHQFQDSSRILNWVPACSGSSCYRQQVRTTARSLLHAELNSWIFHLVAFWSKHKSSAEMSQFSWTVTPTCSNPFAICDSKVQ